ncbi:hypothetical protein UFOVP813_8 [uncultured Caudovirales phage]|uniref:Uncharacterized protein n=1 Tax=uncultured Caudovirales phage TaxID=2100421 RepID=A0A6J5P1L4_9CAUD|nr:hypothetical protein UFOVP813_8 [uncultured Caudovirales phage]
MAGPAADRGTAMDSVFRSILGGSFVAWNPDTVQGDRSAIEWAVARVRLLAGSDAIQSDEDDLRVEMLGMQGTADYAVPVQRCSGDLKSGQIRNYDEQQAAYAIGFMEREFVSEWTTHLLFCDERVMVTRHWTLESACDLAAPIVALARTPGIPATPNEYCGWCAHRWTCKERLEPLSLLLTGAPGNLDLATIKQHPEDLARLLDITHEITRDDGLHDELRRSALSHVLAGAAVPGWSLMGGRKSETAAATMLGENYGKKNPLRDGGSARVLAACGNITGSKFKELWSAIYGETEAVPDGIIKESHGASYLAKSKKKKATK